MRVLENGIYRDATEEEVARANSYIRPPYKDRVIARIRRVYSVDDELAILRQRDTKPEEFEEYNTFVETIKAEEKGSETQNDS